MTFSLARCVSRSLKSFSLAFIFAIAVPQLVHADELIRLDIPAQDLGAALREFAKAAHQQIVFDSQRVRGLTSAPLSGNYSIDEALHVLLANTGLSLSKTTAGVYYVEAKTDGPLDARRDTRSSPDKGLEEIIVTAQKHEERLIDVPVSVVAITGKEIEERHISSLDDLSFSIPGLAVGSNGSFLRRIEIRGISNAIAGSQSLIGIYLDEADVTLEPTGQLDLSAFDLERVEVLRGPQGTLYGAGSAGGTVRFITNRPALGAFGASVDLIETFSQYGAPGERGNIMLNVPLISDELGLRIAGTFDQGGGWIDVPATNLKNYNGANLVNVRIEGLWRPVEQFTVNATEIIYRNDTPPNLGENPVGILTPFFGGTIPPTVEGSYSVGNLTLNYDFDSFHILNTTSYLHQNRPFANMPVYGQFTPPGTPLTYFNETGYFREKSFNDELRVSSLGSNAWQWTAGVYYKDERDTGDNGATFDASGPFFDFGSTDLSSKSWSFFGDTSYKLWDRLTLGAGVRTFHNDQVYVNGPPPLTTQSGDFHSVDPRFYAQFKITDEFNLYTSIAKGFRSGGFNSLSQPTYGPEDVWTYELGTKASVLEGHLSVDFDVFHSNYQNYQVQGVYPANPAISYVANGGDVKIDGVEWNAAWRVWGQWSFSLNGDYLNAKFTKIAATDANYIVGDPVDFVPKYSFTVGIRRDFSVQNRNGYFRLDYDQQGRETYRLRSIGPWYFGESDVIHMLNFNANLNLSEDFRLGFFADNLINDRGYTDPFGNENGAPRSRPRTFGVEFGFKFN